MKDNEETVKSREYTKEEVSAQFLRYINKNIQYWENETGAPNSLSKLEGLAFSILVAIDGESSALPKFILAPDPSPDDKEDSIENGRNYYPENYESNVKCNISGDLHDRLKSKDGSDNVKMTKEKLENISSKKVDMFFLETLKFRQATVVGLYNILENYAKNKAKKASISTEKQIVSTDNDALEVYRAIQDSRHRRRIKFRGLGRSKRRLLEKYLKERALIK